MIINYIVKFNLYHYNSGDGHNGYFTHEKKFNNYENAILFYNHLKWWILGKRETSDFAKNYCWDGFLSSINGLYKITTEKIL